MSDEALAGDFPPNPIEKSGYRLEFSDEFEGNELNLDNWLPFYLPHWSSRELSTPNYYLADSSLVLQVTKEQRPWCPEFDGNIKCSSIQTGEFAGPVGSTIGQHRFNSQCVVRQAQTNVQKYTPQYGYFEIRAKGSNLSATLASLWMIGYEGVGEICPFEIVGAHCSATSSRIRYGVHPYGDLHLKDEFYEETLAIDTAQFHVYGLEWRPDRIDFYVDNAKTRTINQSPAYPMQFMLGVYEIPTDNDWTGVYDPEVSTPRLFTIDYFRAYQDTVGEIGLELNLVKLEIFSTVEISLESLTL